MDQSRNYRKKYIKNTELNGIKTQHIKNVWLNNILASQIQ